MDKEELIWDKVEIVDRVVCRNKALWEFSLKINGTEIHNVESYQIARKGEGVNVTFTLALPDINLTLENDYK